jgi:hypothetical protein
MTLNTRKEEDMKRLASLLAIAALVATACGSSSTSPTPGTPVPGTTPVSGVTPAPTPAPSVAPTAVEGGNMVVALDGDMVFADPSFVSDGNSLYVDAQVVQNLVQLQPGTISTVIPVRTSTPTPSSTTTPAGRTTPRATSRTTPTTMAPSSVGSGPTPTSPR